MGRGGTRNAGMEEEGTRADPGTYGEKRGMGGCKYRREGCGGDALTKMAEAELGMLEWRRR